MAEREGYACCANLSIEAADLPKMKGRTPVTLQEKPRVTGAEGDYLAEAGAALVGREGEACPARDRVGWGALSYCAASAGTGSGRVEEAGRRTGAEVVDKLAARRAPSRIIGASTR